MTHQHILSLFMPFLLYLLCRRPAVGGGHKAMLAIRLSVSFGMVCWHPSAIDMCISLHHMIACYICLLWLRVWGMWLLFHATV